MWKIQHTALLKAYLDGVMEEMEAKEGLKLAQELWESICVTARQEQEQARSTENGEPNKGCTNEPGNVRGAGAVIVTLLLDCACT